MWVQNLGLEVQFSQGISCYIFPIREQKAFSLWPTQIPFRSPGRAAHGAPSAVAADPKGSGQLCLTPAVFPCALGWARLLPVAAPGPAALSPAPLCSRAAPGPALSTAPKPSKTRPQPCSCAGPASRRKQRQPGRWAFPRHWACMAVFSLLLLPGEATPEQLLQRAQFPSVMDTLSFTHKNRGRQGITGGWFERKARRKLGWAGHLPSFPAEPIFSMLRRPCLGPCTNFPGLAITSPKSRASSRMLWMPVLHQWGLTALPRSQQCWELWGKLITLLFV